MGHQLKYGIVSDVKPGFARVYFEEDELVSDYWPVIVRFSMTDKESWPLNPKEHVACLCDERCEEGVIIGAIHSDPEPADSGAGAGKFRKVFADGTYIEYDKGMHKLTASVAGSVDVSATGNISAKASTQIIVEAPDIQLKGNVTVLGIVTAGGISAAPMPGVSGADGKILADADIETTGKIKGAIVTAGGVSLTAHVHTGGTAPSGLTGNPVPQ